MIKEVIVPADDLVCIGKDKLQEVIRCKDCVDCKETSFDGRAWKYCETIGSIVNDDDYCSWAERKEE